MNSAPRPVALIALSAASLLLAGCSLLGLGGLERGDDGQVTASSEVSSSELLTGDCFSYLGDGSNLSRVTIAPCTTDHTHTVLAQGTLTPAQIEEVGGIQNAISAECAETFATFKEALAEGLRTKQEFLVSKRTVDEVEVQAYSCVALDPKADPATEEPGDEPTEDVEG